MQESIDPKLILEALLKPMDGGLKNISSPKPGSEEAGDMWNQVLPYRMPKNPAQFSAGMEQAQPGSNEQIWNNYVEERKMPIDAIIKMISGK